MGITATITCDKVPGSRGEITVIVYAVSNLSIILVLPVYSSRPCIIIINNSKYNNYLIIGTR